MSQEALGLFFALPDASWCLEQFTLFMPLFLYVLPENTDDVGFCKIIHKHWMAEYQRHNNYQLKIILIFQPYFLIPNTPYKPQGNRE